jgi:hypothetical protein
MSRKVRAVTPRPIRSGCPSYLISVRSPLLPADLAGQVMPAMVLKGTSAYPLQTSRARQAARCEDVCGRIEKISWTQMAKTEAILTAIHARDPRQPDSIDVAVGRRVRIERMARGLSQTELANKRSKD